MNKLINLLHEHGIWKQNLLSVIYGLKPMLRISLNQELYFLLKKHLNYLKLRCLIYKSKSLNTHIALIGKEKAHLSSAYSFIKNNKEDTVEFNQKIGELLGYPKCCCDAFQQPKIVKDPVLPPDKNPYKKINWKLNYIFNMESREPIKGSSQVHMMARAGYRGWDKYIIPHTPCSFKCKESLNYAEKLYEILEKQFPGYALLIKYYLSKIIVYFNIYEFIVLEGQIKGRNIYYDKVLDVDNLMDKRIIQKFEEGNNILLHKDRMKVRKIKDKIISVGCDFKVFNFQ